jgi:DNA-binding NarL/FixJ family response regulator
MADHRIKVLLVDDHTVVRNGVRLMLSAESDIEVAGEADTAQNALSLVRDNDYHVALVDVALPDKNGLDLLKLLRAQKPNLAVLILSMYSEEAYAVRALKLGAAGYLTKDSPVNTLVTAVRKAANGGKYISHTLVDKLANMIGGENLAPHEALSNRELEVMRLIASGESLVKIAELLHLSPNTVTTYRTRILEKMHLTNNAELARYALENGLVF